VIFLFKFIHIPLAPSHSGSKTTSWMNENIPPGLKVPAHSPDLNAIEHLWAIMKKRVQKSQPSSRQELLENILKEWDKLRNSYTFNLFFLN